MDIEKIFEKVSIVNAKKFQLDVKSFLEKYGYICNTEVSVRDRGDGKKGRIDLVAEKDGQIIAIECDRKTARKKSILKLRMYSCNRRIILLRETQEIIEL